MKKLLEWKQSANFRCGHLLLENPVLRILKKLLTATKKLSVASKFAEGLGGMIILLKEMGHLKTKWL